MNGLKLKTLEIKNFRGIRNLTLDFDKKSWFIRGANGTGKSSIVNALQYLFTDSINISEDTGVNEDNMTIPHIHANKEDVLIKAEFTKGTRTKTFDKVKSSKGLNNYIDSSFKHASFILNRSKLLDFVDAKDKERYDKLSTLFGFGYLDDMEDSFKKGKSSIKAPLRSHLKESYSLLYNIFNKGVFLENIGSKSNPSRAAINKEYAKLIDKFNDILESNELDLIDDKTDFIEYKYNLHEHLLYGKVDEYKKDILDLLNNLGISKDEFNKIIKGYNDIVQTNLKSSDLLLNLLKDSKKYLEITDDESCPICGNKNIDIENIQSSITNEIVKLEDNLSNFNDWKVNTQSFIAILNDLITNLNNLEINITQLNKTLSNFESSILIEEDIIISSKDITTNLINDLINLINHNISITDLNNEHIYSLSNNLDLIKNNIQEKINNLDLKNSNEELSFIYDSLDDLNTFSNLSKKIEILNNQFNKADATHKLFSKLKVGYIDEVIKQIEDDVIEYYTFIHNDDKIKNPRLIASKSKGVKLVVDAFGIEESDPRSYSSEGHLDSLGLCIFLAAVKNLNEVPIIVLDDIIATVDMSHKDRIAKLLFEKFNKYQFIITTHNKLWLQQFKLLNSFYKDEGQDNFRFCEIIDWDMYNGPKFREFIDDKEMIKHHLDSDYQDLPAAANGARRYLEHTLYDICNEYRANVPISDKYSVGDLFKPAKEKLLELTKGTEFEGYYENIFKDLNKYKYPANALSHFNETNNLLEYDEVKPYVDAVFKLRDSVTCDKCNSMLSIKNKKISCSKKSKHYKVNI